MFSGSIPLQRPQTCFLSGSLSIHQGCQRHDQTPLLFPTCGRTDNVFSILEHSRCVSGEVGQKAARLSSLAAGGQPATFSFFICENHRNARSHAQFAEDGSKQQRSRGATTPTDRHRHSGHRDGQNLFLNSKVTEGSFDNSTTQEKSHACNTNYWFQGRKQPSAWYITNSWGSITGARSGS